MFKYKSIFLFLILLFSFNLAFAGTAEKEFKKTIPFIENGTVILKNINGSVEVESWDSVAQEAFLWVRVPTIEAASNTILTLYYDSTHADNIGYIGEALSWWVNAKDFCDVLIKLAKIGITIYSIEEEVKERGLYPFELLQSKLKKK